MNRRITIYLICLCFFAFGTTHASEIQILNTKAAENYSFSAEGDALWLSNGADLFLSIKSGSGEHLYSFDDEVIHISAKDDAAYVVAKNEGSYQVYSISESGAVSEKFSLPAEQQVLEIMAFDDCVAVLSDSGQGYGYNLTFYTHQGESTGFQLENLFSVSRMDTQQFACTSFGADETELSIYTLDGFKCIGKMLLPHPIQFTYAGQNRFIGVMNNELAVLNMNNGTIIPAVSPLTDISNSSSMQMTNMGLLIGNRFSDSLIVVERNVVEELLVDKGRSLTLVNIPDVSEYRLSEAIKDFKKANMDINVIQKTMTEEQLIVELQSKSSGIDVLYVDCESAPRYIEAGVLADIGTNQEIVEALGDWIDIKKTIACAGQLYGVPITIHSTYLQYHEELLAHLSIAMPDRFDSWFQFFDMADALEGSLPASRISLLSDDIYYPAFVSQFTSGFINPKEIDFGDPYFVEMSEKYKSLVNRGKIRYMFDHDNESDNSLVYVQAGNLPTLGISSNIHPLPALWNREINHAYVMAMGVNAHSKDVDACLAFLACYARSQASDYEVGYLRDMCNYPYYEEYNNDERKHVDTLRTIMSDSVPELVNVVFRPYARECFADFYAGKIDVVTLCKNLQDKLDMILNE